MQVPLKEIRNELKDLNAPELAELALRLARYKKENKELLNYLLFYADRPDEYLAGIKQELEAEFSRIASRDFLAVKTLRKILRQLSKHSRFTGLKWAEAELLLWFCRNYLTYTNTSSSYKALRTLFVRQVVKVNNLSGDLHEDLRHDVTTELEKVLHWAETSLRGFRRSDAGL